MRDKHVFQFHSKAISKAAEAEAKYHREREAYWRGEYDKNVGIVESTIGAKLERQAYTGGYSISVVVDYGDAAAYNRLREAFGKIDSHRQAAEHYETDAKLYATQSVSYDLDVNDVHYYRLGDEPRGDSE